MHASLCSQLKRPAALCRWEPALGNRVTWGGGEGEAGVIRDIRAGTSTSGVRVLVEVDSHEGEPGRHKWLPSTRVTPCCAVRVRCVITRSTALEGWSERAASCAGTETVATERRCSSHRLHLLPQHSRAHSPHSELNTGRRRV
jgi:hypothetical protein